MVILLLLSVIYIVGFLITVLHETAHIASIYEIGETPQYVQIGVPTLLCIKYRNIVFYPLFPFAGRTYMTLHTNPSKFRMLVFTLAGCIAGITASISCGFFGYMLLPNEALTEFHRNGHRLGFLLRDILSGSSDLQTTCATALIMSAVIFGIQHIGNLAPVKHYDGHNFLRVLFHRQQ